MEAAHFGVDPGIQSTFEQTSFVRVCTVALEGTGIAGACGCAVQGDAALKIGTQLHELVACGALPVVQLTKVDKARVPIAFRPLLGTARQILEQSRNTHQKQSVGEREKDFAMDT